MIHPTGDPPMSLMCTSANREPCVAQWRLSFLDFYSTNMKVFKKKRKKKKRKYFSPNGAAADFN